MYVIQQSIELDGRNAIPFFAISLRIPKNSPYEISLKSDLIQQNVSSYIGPSNAWRVEKLCSTS